MESLYNLIDYLRSIKAPVTKLLREGESGKVLQYKLEGEGLIATKQLVEVYKIVDGTSMNEDHLGLQYFFPGFILVSLDQALELYDEECKEYGSWPEGYLPVFWNGNRDYLLVNCRSEDNGVYYFSPDEFRFDGLGKIYDSLDLLFMTVLECFKEGGYALGDHLEDINHQYEIVNVLSKRMNPDSVFWIISEGNEG
ncbi:SMI1/KNR4 family protein [Chitinophaga sp. XS-30]|uniref:SMI1/KNR4 family protein n=1 Tax=Chitinophaga sp. XS-30 TaxID=2604421 RepID=UPI0011DCBB82|nr:SMI1/KNR4 family protein [Chitinophaga sp. XS-30]QEH41136.1 SMI1/KNR4 family protein [Chitinophaga sp. XS-30]